MRDSQRFLISSICSSLSSLFISFLTLLEVSTCSTTTGLCSFLFYDLIVFDRLIFCLLSLRTTIEEP